ncbi:MAG: ribosome silencing factor [Gammaproteobacteria bacterium]
MTDLKTDTQDLLNVVIQALEDLKAQDVVILDVRTRANFTNYMIVTSGTSTRHVKSIADEVVEKAKPAGYPALGVEGYAYGEWVLVDLGDVVVHVMLPATREFYHLEKLWSMEE